MRADISRRLLGEIRALIVERLPRFAAVRGVRRHGLPGGALYEWPMVGSWAYVWVRPDRAYDSFAVEIAWTAKRGYPRFYTPFPEREPRGPHGRYYGLRKGYAKFGLGELWDERDAVNRWSVGDCRTTDLTTLLSPPQKPVVKLVGEIRRKAADVVEMVALHAVPFFERRAGLRAPNLGGVTHPRRRRPPGHRRRSRSSRSGSDPARPTPQALRNCARPRQVPSSRSPLVRSERRGRAGPWFSSEGTASTPAAR